MTAPTVVTIPAASAGIFRQAAEHLRSQSDDKPRNDSPVGSMVVRSGEVERVCRGLIDRFPETFGHMDQWSVVHAEDGNPPKKGCKSRARATIIPPVWQQLYGDDLAVIVSEKWWDQATHDERVACLFHTLSHVWTATEPETGEVVGLRMRDHDLESFHDEVAHFGAWRAELRETVRQLAMFDDSVAR